MKQKRKRFLFYPKAQRRKELLDVPIDKPQLFQSILAFWNSELNYSTNEIAENMGGVFLNEMEQWLGIEKPPGIKIMRVASNILIEITA